MFDGDDDFRKTKEGNLVLQKFDDGNLRKDAMHCDGGGSDDDLDIGRTMTFGSLRLSMMNIIRD